MELRAYIHVLRAKWWIVVFTFVITYIATLVFTFIQAPLYQSNATFVVKLSPAFRNDKELATAVDILSRRTEIGTTFTQVADSRTIKRLAATELDLSPEQRADFSVTSELVPGTNVLKISTLAHDPVLARNVTNAVGVHTITYVQNLYDIYKLEPLDQASLPDDPISPNKPLNLTLGGIMGIALGSGFALLATYLQAQGGQLAAFNIVDDETGAYNRRYLDLRLRQELARSKRTDAPLTLALINVDGQDRFEGLPSHLQGDMLRRVALLLSSWVGEADVVARFEGSIFALLLLDTSGDIAAATTAKIQVGLAATPIDIPHHDATLHVQALVGYAVCADPSISVDDLVANARRALDEAQAAAGGTIFPIFPNAPTHQLSVAKAARYE